MYPTKYTTPLLGLDWLEWYQAHRVYHPGVDFGLVGQSDCGQNVYAAKNGQVVYVHNNVLTSGGFGKFVIIKHEDGNYTRSAHLEDTDVVEHQEVKEADLIGKLGNTGTTYCHLHFEAFNEKCAEIQRKHWRPWRFYPGGKTKAWVQEHYLNPWEWLKKETEKTDLEIAYNWAVDRKIVRSSKPKDIPTVDMICLMLDRFKETLKP